VVDPEAIARGYSAGSAPAAHAVGCAAVEGDLPLVRKTRRQVTV
jgi:hypothetical protein